MTEREYKSQDEKAADAFDEWCDQALKIVKEDQEQEEIIADERLAYWYIW